MTDKEIIKALEVCTDGESEGCDSCPFYNGFGCYIDFKGILDLIKRQQVEIEKIRSADPMDFCGVLCDFSEELINKARAEAVKDFAEKLKINAMYWIDDEGTKFHMYPERILDNLVKEMVGADNG